MNNKMKKNSNLTKLILVALFSAIVIVFTVIPNLGYISTGPIEITTLHIIVIIGAVFLGPKYGAVIGGVWGITCIVRAFVLGGGSEIFKPFLNPLVSFVPRVLVGLFAGLVFAALKKTKLNTAVSASIAGAVGTLTNTVFVLSALYIFGMEISGYQAFFDMFKTIITTIISLNGSIELISAVVVVPLIYKPLSKYTGRLRIN